MENLSPSALGSAKLTELINIFSEKYSTTIMDISKKSKWEINFPVPLSLDPRFEYEIGMTFVSVYNTVFNITKDNDTLTEYTEGYTEGSRNGKVIQITPGAREVKNINEYLQNSLEKENILIEEDIATGKCKLTTKLDIKFNSLYSVLGFDKDKLYKAGTHLSENKINVTDLVTINISCSIAEGGYIPSVQAKGDIHSVKAKGDIRKHKELQSSNIIHSFPSHIVPPGYKYLEQKNPPIYFPITTKKIEKVVIYIVDQNGTLISFDDEDIAISLNLKQV